MNNTKSYNINNCYCPNEQHNLTMTKMNNELINQEKNFFKVFNNIDEELYHKQLEYVYDFIDRNKEGYQDSPKKFKELVCFGNSNGCKDPYLLIKRMLDNRMFYPDSLTVVDNDLDIFDQCFYKLKFYDIPKKQFYSSNFKDLKVYPNNIYTKSIYCLYSTGYLIESLRYFKENRDVFGTDFKIYQLIHIRGEVERHDHISFDIEDLERYEEKILELKNRPNFLAYSLETDQGFTTHFFEHLALINFLNNVVPNDVLNRVNEYEDKYFIVDFGSDFGRKIVVAFNNVLGNVPYYDLVETFKKISENFYYDVAVRYKF